MSHRARPRRRWCAGSTERFPNVLGDPGARGAGRRRPGGGDDRSAIRLVALLTLAAGVLVLAGAVAAGHRRRVYDAVVLKVLGATRGSIAAAFLIEQGLTGLATAVVAGGIRHAGGLCPGHADRSTATGCSLPGPLLAGLGLAVLLTVTLGFAGTWHALGAKPAPYLRNE